MNAAINPSDIRVNHSASAMVNGGFRSGRWHVEHAGINYTVYASVPAQCDLSEQTQRVQKTAARAIETSIKPKGQGLIGGAELAS